MASSQYCFQPEKQEIAVNSEQEHHRGANAIQCFPTNPSVLVELLYTIDV